MKRSILVCMTLAVVFGGSVALVFADDTFPPPWQRGGDRTTYQDWTFGTSNNPLPPDVDNVNPYGKPSATILDGVWANFHDNHVGVWSLLADDSYINVPIPNAPDHPDWNKLVWTQLTWSPEQSPNGEVGSPSVFVDGLQSQLQETVPLHDSWFQSTWFTTLPYNPRSETVHITGFIDVGELVVDTKCAVPEPCSLALLAMGAIGLAAFVWRRKQSA
jgi:hypothetical protein